MRWHGPNQTLQVGDFVLTHPLTYSSDGKTSIEPSAIGNQPIGKNYSHDMLGYWPSYDMMNAGQRWIYLEWMANGRQQMPPELGYAFVFFYGLERRALKYNCDEQVIFAEVMRLRALHIAQSEKPSGSFLSYTSSLLWLLLSKNPQQWDASQVKPLVEAQRWQSDRTPVALTWCAAHASHVPSWLAFKIAGGTSMQQGVAAKTTPDEFRQLFHLRYHETWPAGIPLKPEPRGVTTKVQVGHYAASAVLGRFTHTVEVPRKVLRSLDKLTPIWTGCADDLRPFASIRAKSLRDVQEEDICAIWEALPASLRKRQHPVNEKLAAVVNPQIAQQNYAPVKVAQITSLLSFPRREKFTNEQSLRLARVAELCDYSIEPDARITGRAYRADDWIVFFGKQIEPINQERYKAAALTLRLGLMVATAEGKADKAQLDLIAKHINEVFKLSISERNRLRGLAGLLMGLGVDLVTTKAVVDTLTPVQREAIGRLLIAVVAYDGIISLSEKKSLKTTFERLGIGTTTLDEYLEKLRSEEGITVVQRSRSAGRGEAIPAPPSEEPIQLNHEAIEQLLKDTREVQQVLTEAMKVDEEPPASPVLLSAADLSESAEDNTDNEPITLGPVTLEARFQPLYSRLIGREAWPVAEATLLAREEGQMLSGALEAINEWALETFGNPLFYEEGDMIIVELEILN